MSQDFQEARGELPVLSPEGAQLQLRDVWADSPAVIAFVRHFGCIFCREQVRDLRARKGEIERLGARLIIVGNGTPEQADSFRTSMRGDLEVYTDPSRETYRAAGLRRGALAAMGPRTWIGTLRAAAGGSFPKGRMGDPLQLGGVFVVLPDGSTPYAHVSRFAGDHPKPDTVLAALDSALKTA
ncbi:MAG: redoxin domain-containing protein [Dehalococcoidia bacterium]|nr:redoxin domain-containing protein [Dehalococcoidia bacterium]